MNDEDWDDESTESIANNLSDKPKPILDMRPPNVKPYMEIIADELANTRLNLDLVTNYTKI